MKNGIPETRRELLEMTLGELVLSASARGVQAVIHPIVFGEDLDAPPSALIALAFGDGAADVYTAYKQVSEARASKDDDSQETRGIGELTEAQINYMVGRFLCWRLPDDFKPDGGVTFQPVINGNPYSPIGTNLLNAHQAEAMVRFMVEGMPIQESR